MKFKNGNLALEKVLGKNSEEAGLEELAQPEDYQEEKYKKKRGRKKKQNNNGVLLQLGNYRFKGESVILQPHSNA